MIAWDTVQNALHSWVSTSSGLTCIWANQNGGRPDGAYISLSLSVSSSARDWVDIEDNPSPSAGAEILYKVRGPRIGVLSIQCFGGPAEGPTQPEALLGLIKASSMLPSISQALSEGGIGISTFGDVIDVSGLLQSTNIESRAALDVRMNLAAEIQETGTYFSNVEVTDEISTPDNDFTVEGDN